MAIKDVNWKIFDIDPWDDSQDVSKSQLQAEYKKYGGSPRNFALELDRRFGWSGMMCELAEQWAKEANV